MRIIRKILLAKFLKIPKRSIKNILLDNYNIEQIMNSKGIRCYKGIKVIPILEIEQGEKEIKNIFKQEKL